MSEAEDDVVWVLVRVPDRVEYGYRIGDSLHLLYVDDEERLAHTVYAHRVTKEVSERLFEVGIALRILSEEEAREAQRARDEHTEELRRVLRYTSSMT